MMIRRFFKLMLISFSAFILAEVTPSKSMAIRFGLSGLVEAVVATRGLPARFMGTTKRVSRAVAPTLSERPKSPVRRGRKPSSPKGEVPDESQQKAFNVPEIPKLLSLEERAALIKICEENCAQTLASLDETAPLQESTYKLGSTAQAVLELGKLLQSEGNRAEALGRDRLYRERAVDIVGMWREGIRGNKEALDAFAPSSRERMSLVRVDRLIGDTLSAAGIPYVSPLTQYLRKLQ